MDTNEVADVVHRQEAMSWVSKVLDMQRAGRIEPWVSSFHPDKLPCTWVTNGSLFFHNGSYNMGIHVVFSDGTSWLVRWAWPGKVSDDYADEKVAMEVSALTLVRERTTIPVPKVHAWGLAASKENTLGLGPFIIMDFIEGVHLDKIFGDHDPMLKGRVIREDVCDADLETIYRQMANFLLQLFQLDFDRIDSLPLPKPTDHSPTKMELEKLEELKRKRPLTFKAHAILHEGDLGALNTFGDREQGFATTTEFFQYVAGQDFQQFIHQPNSSFCNDRAISEYKAFKALQSLVPDLINERYDRCKFKLICDDLGLGNLIVRSKEDLTIVGVVDLEWSYSGPAQLFGSAPWWLLRDRPTGPDWDKGLETDETPKVAARYLKCLETFIRILEEEEAKLPEHEQRELSSLVKWSQASGAMWLHIILSAPANGEKNFPFTMLRRHLGATEWTRRKSAFDTEELQTFGKHKEIEWEVWDKALYKLEDEKKRVDSEEMTSDEFLAKAAPIMEQYFKALVELKDEKMRVDSGEMKSEEFPVKAALILKEYSEALDKLNDENRSSEFVANGTTEDHDVGRNETESNEVMSDEMKHNEARNGEVRDEEVENNEASKDEARNDEVESNEVRDDEV